MNMNKCESIRIEKINYDIKKLLRNIASSNIDKFFKSEIIVRNIFSSLSPDSQNFILRLIFCNTTITNSIIREWKNLNLKLIKNEIKPLFILNVKDISSSNRVYEINPIFSKTLQTHLLNRSIANVFCQHETETKKLYRDLKYLKNYSIERWSSLLLYLVNPSRSQLLSSTLKDIILKLNLIHYDENKSTNMTKNGFYFLLLDQWKQLWYFFYHYFIILKNANQDIYEILEILYCISDLDTSMLYTLHLSSETQLEFIQILREIGIIYIKSRKQGCFQITPLAKLCRSKYTDNEIDEKCNVDNSHGFIVVQSNFRLVAYTDFELHYEILNIFCKIEYKYPSVIVGTITYNSILNAFSKGLCAKQIVEYLNENLDFRKGAKNSIMPPTVTDQIYLWEKCRNRFKFKNSVMYENFTSTKEYTTFLNFAKESNSLLFVNATKMTIVVSAEGHEKISTKFKRNK
ncbi:RNA polymerase II transcription factor B subunit [Intoshia linei]|uniref:General transcription factor IIH subunit 4 n=1 Tax=Intoshia linei TaxID=1819745 RepID=A0A177B1S2_9BILA|nr:RNA polymerase II transcription factor B subunit [Intoshia linei]